MSPYSHSDTGNHVNQATPPPPYNTWSANYQCDTNATECVTYGVTLWQNLSSPGKGWTDTIAPNGNRVYSFTGTQPRCYNGEDSCNVHYTAVALSPGDNNNDIELAYTLNNEPEQPLCYISGKAGEGVEQSFELACLNMNGKYNKYHDTAENTLTIYNKSSTVSVQIIDLQIIRTYKMVRLSDQSSTPAEVYIPAYGNLDGSTRYDYPCNNTYCGCRSYSQHLDRKFDKAVLPKNGGKFTWDLDWSLTWTSGKHNYEGGNICLFNFNQMYATYPTANQPQIDPCLVAKVNNVQCATFYLGKGKVVIDENEQPKLEYHGAFPSVDLMKYSLGDGTGYNDSGPNKITLTNNSDVDIQLADYLGINVYRIYNTACLPPPPPPYPLPPNYQHYNIPHVDNTPHTNYNDAAANDFNDHCNVAHTNTAYYDQAYYDHGDAQYADFTNYTNASFTDHNNVPFEDNRYLDWQHYDETYIPFTDFSNHCDLAFTDWPNHTDNPHTNYGNP